MHVRLHMAGQGYEVPTDQVIIDRVEPDGNFFVRLANALHFKRQAAIASFKAGTWPDLTVPGYEIADIVKMQVFFDFGDDHDEVLFVSAPLAKWIESEKARPVLTRVGARTMESLRDNLFATGILISWDDGREEG